MKNNSSLIALRGTAFALLLGSAAHAQPSLRSRVTVPSTAVEVGAARPSLSTTLSTDSVPRLVPAPGSSLGLGVDDVDAPRLDPAVLEYFRALRAIEQKAAQLPWLGAALGDVQDAQGGFVQRYEAGDIYFSVATGAHEVHGDIRLKFDEAAPPLGLPTTDERATPDGLGRFNHFTGGSVYWTPQTGPKIVRGAIRDLWQQRGWERGALGYPVQDEYRVRSSASEPEMWWSVFQNGAIVATRDRVSGALEVMDSSVANGYSLHIEAARVKDLLWHRFDYMVHQASDDLGLHPRIEIVNVSDWGPAFDHSRRRQVTFALHGFRDNGIWSDTDFDVDMRLSFDVVWDAGAPQEPSAKTLVVKLESVTVGANGLASGSIAAGLRDGVLAAFGSPRALVTFPVNDLGRMSEGFAPDFVDLIITADGGMDLLMNPIPGWFARGIRLPAIEDALDDVFGG